MITDAANKSKEIFNKPNNLVAVSAINSHPLSSQQRNFSTEENRQLQRHVDNQSRNAISFNAPKSTLHSLSIPEIFLSSPHSNQSMFNSKPKKVIPSLRQHANIRTSSIQNKNTPPSIKLNTSAKSFTSTPEKLAINEIHQ